MSMMFFYGFYFCLSTRKKNSRRTEINKKNVYFIKLFIRLAPKNTQDITTFGFLVFFSRMGYSRNLKRLQNLDYITSTSINKLISFLHSHKQNSLVADKMVVILWLHISTCTGSICNWCV